MTNIFIRHCQCGLMSEATRTRKGYIVGQGLKQQTHRVFHAGLEPGAAEKDDGEA